MTALGDTLEAMSTSARRWSSLQADLRGWVDHAAVAAAVSTAQATRGFRVVVSPPGAPGNQQAPAGMDTRRGSLQATPESLRVDWHGDSDGNPDSDGVVVRGLQWRRRHCGKVHGSRPAAAEFGLTAVGISELALVRPWLVLSGLDLAAPRPDAQERDGRPATWVRGVPRDQNFAPRLHNLPEGDSYDLVVDDATGVLLELTAWSGERKTEQLSLRAPRFDAPIDPRRFDLGAVGTVAESERLGGQARPLAALAREVDFTVLAPRDLTYAGVLENDEDGAAIVAHSYGGRLPISRVWFVQSRGARMADPAEWKPIALADGTPARWWSPADDSDQGHVRFERAGTQIWVLGHGRREIHDLAISLAPVSWPESEPFPSSTRTCGDPGHEP
ncbi:hypothetical protein Ga0074812_119122 [Parafrankia irregularis]|uniref:Uncharacterized protein n=1 Tax=Parafrankia irregularis TaxID=795642 RepID=A0A0S4QUG5_9ACTN|nr:MULTISPECIES: hypothetical protein [Parafrankia]MBE3204634.1 hypothetical protein [Parafrankia sp. CH37]CUU58488.1 hypothetical protein Ga0074812_119122 [Parafrankia irregularis]